MGGVRGGAAAADSRWFFLVLGEGIGERGWWLFVLEQSLGFFGFVMDMRKCCF